MLRFSRFSCSVALVAAFALGCTDPDTDGTNVMDEHDHDHGHEHGHDHGAPDSFAEAVAAITEARDEIKAAFAKKQPDDADGALHDAPEILSNIVELAESAGIEGDELAKVKQAVTDLDESIEAIHDGMHGGQGSTFDDVAEKTNSAIAVLQGFAEEHEGHDHDEDHDHDEGHDHDEDHDHDHDDHMDDKQ